MLLFVVASFWVCEKSDGVRVLLLVQTVPAPQGLSQSVFLVGLLYFLLKLVPKDTMPD